MEFSYAEYKYMIEVLRDEGYFFEKYKQEYGQNKICILRHDVDNSIAKALKFAENEHKLGVKSTYFILLRSDFYNIFSKKSSEMIKEICQMGHDIGLHFDPTFYQENNIIHSIKEEVSILEHWLNVPINSFSMHKPSEKVLSSEIIADGMLNAYSNYFFKEFKYVSDSRHFWRENVIEIIKSGRYEKLQILTHPFWYDNDNRTARETLLIYLNESKKNRYSQLLDEITNLEEFIKEGDI